MENKSSRGTYLLKNTAIFFIGNLATKFISFFLVPLYTNVLNTAEYGTVDLVTTISTVLAPIIILNIGEGVMRFALDKDADHDKIMSIGLTVFAFSLIAGLAIVPISSVFKTISEYSWYIYFYTVTLAGSQLFLCYLRGKEKLFFYTLGNIVHTLGVALFNILFLLVFHWGIKGYFLAYILANAVTILFAASAGKVYQVLSHYNYDSHLAKLMYRYSVVFIPYNFMWWITHSSDRIMVTAMIGASANGIYAISYKIPTLIQSFTTVFNQAWGYSAIRENDSSDRDEYFNTVFQGFVGGSSIFGIGLLAIMKPFLKIYVEESYYEAWKYTPYLIVGYVFLTAATFLSTAYNVNKDSKGFLFSSTCGAIINIVLNYLLIPVMGVSGAAAATCVSYIGVFIYIAVDTRRYQKLDILNTRCVVGCVILLLAAGALFIDSIAGQIFLWCCFAAEVILYKKVWLPIVLDLIKKIKEKKK